MDLRDLLFLAARFLGSFGSAAFVSHVEASRLHVEQVAHRGDKILSTMTGDTTVFYFPSFKKCTTADIRNISLLLHLCRFTPQAHELFISSNPLPTKNTISLLRDLATPTLQQVLGNTQIAGHACNYLSRLLRELNSYAFEFSGYLCLDFFSFTSTSGEHYRSELRCSLFPGRTKMCRVHQAPFGQIHA